MLSRRVSIVDSGVPPKALLSCSPYSTMGRVAVEECECCAYVLASKCLLSGTRTTYPCEAVDAHRLLPTPPAFRGRHSTRALLSNPLPTPTARHHTRVFVLADLRSAKSGRCDAIARLASRVKHP